MESSNMPKRKGPPVPSTRGGFEPTWPEGHGLLRAARLTSFATRAGAVTAFVSRPPGRARGLSERRSTSTFHSWENACIEKTMSRAWTGTMTG